jgi:hypothetical protein
MKGLRDIIKILNFIKTFHSGIDFVCMRNIMPLAETTG